MRILMPNKLYTTAVFFILVYFTVFARYAMLKELHARTKKCQQHTNQQPCFFICGWCHIDNEKKQNKLFLFEQEACD